MHQGGTTQILERKLDSTVVVIFLLMQKHMVTVQSLLILRDFTDIASVRLFFCNCLFEYLQTSACITSGSVWPSCFLMLFWTTPFCCSKSQPSTMTLDFALCLQNSYALASLPTLSVIFHHPALKDFFLLKAKAFPTFVSSPSVERRWFYFIQLFWESSFMLPLGKVCPWKYIAPLSVLCLAFWDYRDHPAICKGHQRNSTSENLPVCSLLRLCSQSGGGEALLVCDRPHCWSLFLSNLGSVDTV